MKKSLSIGLMVLVMSFTLAISAFGEDRLIVQDPSGNTKFVVTDGGQVGIGTDTPGQDLDIVAPNNGLMRLSDVTTDQTMKAGRMVVRHYLNAQLPLYIFGAASLATDNYVAFGGGSNSANAATQIDFFTAPNTTTATGISRLRILRNGYIGLGVQPSYPLHMASGARCTTGGVWTNASSRELKENIKDLSSSDALLAFNKLNPVTFNYKVDSLDKHVGFIAEDVPDLVATPDKKALSPMDIVALLTKVVQEQQKTIATLNEKVSKLEQQGK
jgi:hypothetical protein